MISWLLSLLGGTTLIAALVFIPGLWLKALAGMKALVDVVCKHPREAIIVAALAWGTYERFDAIHARKVTVAWASRWDSHIAADRASIAQAIQWKRGFDTASAKLSTAIKDKSDAETRLNSALANSLRLRGPGRAAALCRPGGSAGPATATSEHIAPGGPADAPMAPMPDDEPMAILPWRELVSRANDADNNRTEVMAWREWYAKNGELLRAKKLELPAPEIGK